MEIIPRAEEVGLADLVEVEPVDSGDWDIIRLNQSGDTRPSMRQRLLEQCHAQINPARLGPERHYCQATCSDRMMNLRVME